MAAIASPQKGATTPNEAIRTRIVQSMDWRYWNQIIREAAYAMGIEEYQIESQTTSMDGLPCYPSIRASIEKIGVAKKSLRSAYVAASRLMSSDPAPELTGLDSITTQIWKELWRVRFQNSSAAEEFEAAFLEGDCHGVGILQLALETNDATNRQRVTMRHSPILQTLLDPSTKNIRKSRYVAFVNWMPYEDAKAQFGDHVKPEMIRKMSYDVGYYRVPYDVVSVVEYFDTGYGKGDPTYAVIIGGSDKNPAIKKRNPFGRILPMAVFQGFRPHGALRPFGRFYLQRSADEAINALLHQIGQLTTEGRPLRIIDETVVDNQQLREWAQGRRHTVQAKKTMDKSSQPVIDVPGMELPKCVMELLDYFGSDFDEQSGLSEIDRGGTPPQQMTAYQVNEEQNAVSQNKGLLVRSTLEFCKEAMEKFYTIAQLFDKDPFEAVIDGCPVIFNNPSARASWMDKILRLPGRVLVTRDSLTPADADAQLQEKWQKIQMLLSMIPYGIDPSRIVEEAVRVVMPGQDPNEWIAKTSAAATAAGSTQPGPTAAPVGEQIAAQTGAGATSHGRPVMQQAPAPQQQQPQQPTGPQFGQA